MTHELWERRRRTFENTAEAYDRYRPTYPDALFDDIKRYADLAPDDHILEIGAGTGRATETFASWGNPLLAIEPAPAMAEIARTKLRRFDNVDIRTDRFEDATLPPNGFGLVTCAQVWHWLDEGTRIERVARCLYAHGTAAIISNVQVAPADTLPFWKRIDSVYRAISEDLGHQGEFASPEDRPDHPLNSSDLFYDHAQVGHPWEWTLDLETYVGLLQTHSPHAALDENTRARLIGDLSEVIASEFDGKVTEHYVAIASLSRRA